MSLLLLLFLNCIYELIQNIPDQCVSILLLLLFILVNLEVTQLIALFAVGDNTQPVSEIVLLQIFFGEIFQIPFGERHLGSDSDLALAPFDGHNPSAEIPSFAVHLDSLLEELLEISSVHDPVFYRVGAIKGELQNLLLFLPPFTTSFFMGAMAAEEAEREGAPPGES